MPTAHKQLLAIFILALALRLLYLALSSDSPYADTLIIDAFSYDRLADRILQGDWLLTTEGIYVHGPLYPYLLALLKWCGFDYGAIRIFQAVLGALSCVLVYRISCPLFPGPIPIIAAIMAAAYWPFIFYNGELLATTLVILVELALAALLLRYADAFTVRTALFAGLLLGLLGMARSNTLLVFPPLVWWIWQTAATRRQRTVLPLVFCAALLLTLSPFLWRNYLVQGSPIPFQGGFSFYMGNNPAADGTPYLRQGLDFQRAELLPLRQGALSAAAKGTFYTDEGLRFIQQQPTAYLGLLYRKLRLFFNAFEIPVSVDLRFAESQSSLNRLLLGFGLLVPFALVGVAWHWRFERKYLLLVAFALVYLATGLVFSVCARYRLPALPFLAVFAAAGFWRLKELLVSADYTRSAAFLGLLAAAFFFVHTGVDPSQVDHLRSPWLLGQVHQRNQRYPQAAEAYLRGLEQLPTDSDIYNSLGVTYQHLKKDKEAEEAFLQAVAWAPDHAKPWDNLGKLYLRQQKLAKARHALEQALKHDPRPANRHSAYHSLGYVFLFQQSYDQARAAFTKALEEKERPKTYFGLANACAHLNLDIEQIRALERVVALDPTFAAAHSNLGVLYLNQMDYTAAESAFLQAIKYNPNSDAAYRHLATLYHRLNQPERARQILAKRRQRQQPLKNRPSGF